MTKEGLSKAGSSKVAGMNKADMKAKAKADIKATAGPSKAGPSKGGSATITIGARSVSSVRISRRRRRPPPPRRPSLCPASSGAGRLGSGGLRPRQEIVETPRSRIRGW
jgi:hypothetical protein